MSSSFRDALSTLKTSSSHTLPTSNSFRGESSGEQSGFLGNLRDNASSFVSNTSSRIASGFGSSSDQDSNATTTTRGEWFGLTLVQRWIGFAGCAVLALFCFVMAFMALPWMVISPQKFATAFSLGGIATISGITLLRGPRAHVVHMISRERIAFTLAYWGSVFFTLLFSVVVHSYLGTLVFVVVQVVALVWYVVSYFPGGTSGLQSTTRSIFGSTRLVLPM